MSVARGIGQNGGKVYSNITMPAEIDLNFTVDNSNGNGLGIRQLKSNGYVRNVFMHTTASPGTNDNTLNPNPIAGYILIQFKQNFNYSLAGMSSFVSPSTGGALTSVTNHDAYIIASLGTTTLAQWQAVGLPKGLTPTVGQSFIAIASQAIGGTGAVVAPGVSAIDHIETIGDPNASIANSSIAANGGAWLLLQCLAAGSLTAPANNSVIALTVRFDRSSVSIPDSAGQSGL